MMVDDPMDLAKELDKESEPASYIRTPINRYPLPANIHQAKSHYYWKHTLRHRLTQSAQGIQKTIQLQRHYSEGRSQRNGHTAPRR